MSSVDLDHRRADAFRRFECRWLVLCCCGLLTFGCGSADDGPPTAPVSGKVLHDGQPVGEGVTANAY